MGAFELCRVARVVAAMTVAALRGTPCHIWWHPHNFGADQADNFANLDALLEAYARLRDAYGFRSWSMGDIAGAVRR